MQTTLLLVRHGQTPWNSLGKIQGCTNIPLDEEGISQAELLSHKLNGNFSALYSSPLKRAYDTALILGKPANLEPIKKEALTEINFGSWEGLNFKEVAAQYPEDFTRWKTDPYEGPMTNGEGSLKACSLRGYHILTELVKAHPGETIVVVSHGGFIKASLIGLFHLKMTMYHQMAMGNTCINTIHFDQNLHPTLLGLNDISHLHTRSVTSV